MLPKLPASRKSNSKFNKETKSIKVNSTTFKKQTELLVVNLWSYRSDSSNSDWCTQTKRAIKNQQKATWIQLKSSECVHSLPTFYQITTCQNITEILWIKKFRYARLLLLLKQGNSKSWTNSIKIRPHLANENRRSGGIGLRGARRRRAVGRRGRRSKRVWRRMGKYWVKWDNFSQKFNNR